MILPQPKMLATVMSDIFQFYPGSADALPGKGAGETLVSSPSTYAELRKITNWRRLLASGDTTPIAHTGNAELWEALPRKPKVHRTDLEKLRQNSQVLPNEDVKLKGNVTEQTDTMEPVAKSSKKTATKKSKVAPQPALEDSGSNAREQPPFTLTQRPEAVFVQNVPQPADEFSPPDMTSDDDTTTIHFCPVCRNYLFAQIESGEDEQHLLRLCRNCGYKQTQVKGGLVSEIVLGERSAEGYKILLNEFTPSDPRLPHIHGTIKCPDPTCPSNKQGQESDIIYMKYDQVNLNFLYICYVCKYTWHSTR
jgi:DNA-directed RNA polymerase subunit M/transcription elongation factor TFIIS